MMKNCLLSRRTPRTEAVVKLSKLKVDHHVQIQLSEDELTKIPVKKEASYKDIKDYVFKKYKLKVSTLYIAQIKRKFGLTECENFNKSKKDVTKIPTCPPEKEEAIIDALAWFGML